MVNNKPIDYANDDTETVRHLVHLRVPSLALGLLLGVLLSFVTSRFEEVLAHDVRIAFFIPFVVYMADAVGTQTQSIYIRNLKVGGVSFHTYLVKETMLGIIFGLFASAISAGISYVWLKSFDLTIAVALSMFAAVALAPLIALIVAEILELEHKDPAVGAGPIATVIQDTLSVLICGLIASAILL